MNDKQTNDMEAWDRFAAAALQGLLAGDRYLQTPVEEACELARQYADAMVARRRDRTKGGAT